MLDSKARHMVDGVSRAVGGAVGRTGLTPNMVTLAGLAVSIAAGWMIVRDRPVAGGLILIAAGILDVLDGAVARATGRVSVFGGFLDSVTDRLSDAIVFGSIVWTAVTAGDELLAALALGCLVAGALIPYIRAKAESLGLDCTVGVAERAERVILVIVGLVLGILTPLLGVLLAASAVTVVQRLVHVHRQVRAQA